MTFDGLSGGVCAIHKDTALTNKWVHLVAEGGQYELDVARTLQHNGAIVILESAYPKGKGIRALDATINGIAAEIKMIEKESYKFFQQARIDILRLK